jgi:serine/threonine protein kinase
MSIEIDPPSMELDDDDGPISHPSLAVGTSGDRDHRTKIESPAGRNKTPPPASARPATKPPPVPGKHSDDPDNRIGSVLGVYRIGELLGKGGMGYVYKAEHIKLGREVALKLLRGDYAKRRDAVLRFFQEAKTVNRVRHRNIVDVTDFVELDDGTTFIIMELLRGQSLGKWARTGVDLPRALAVLVQICDGLGAAHAVGVVHRDLKPDNVIVIPTSDGAELVKLLDFGVAKLVNREDHDDDIGFQTAAGSVIGTPAYMSPEQAGGMAVDHRSDIYSLGAIMYELFCGQPMFRGRSFGEYVRKHLTEAPTPPRQTANGAHIDERLEHLILKCLAKDPNERFSHILELRDGLLHLLGGIETQPPGSIVLSHSSIRSAPTVSPQYQQLPPHMLPLLPGMVTTQPTPGPHSHHPGVSGHHPSLGYSQYVVGGKPTPWWVWFVGGAIAVGLGISGALWYANRGVPTAAQQQANETTKPTTAPIVQKLVELRFDSLPSGGVYAEGRSAELCRTPCNFNVDLGDGGPPDRRAFVVRANGYEDKMVEVDFAVSQRDFSVSLTRLPGAAPDVDVASDPVETVDLTGTDSPDSLGKAPGKSRKGKAKAKARTKPEEVEETKVETPTPTPPEVKIEDKKPDVKKPVDKIDRTDTIDPFRKK